MKKGDKVICIDVDEIDSLELYKVYQISDCLTTRYLIILNIEGLEQWYRQSRFISLSEYRKQKLEKINKL